MTWRLLTVGGMARREEHKALHSSFLVSGVFVWLSEGTKENRDMWMVRCEQLDLYDTPIGPKNSMTVKEAQEQALKMAIKEALKKSQKCLSIAATLKQEVSVTSNVFPDEEKGA